MSRILFPDLSDYQPSVNLTALTRWQRRHFGISFVFLKASERDGGKSYPSHTFTARWKQLDHLAEVRGAYYFADVGGGGSPKTQADELVNIVKDAGLRHGIRGKADILCLDAERGDLSPRSSRLWMGEFLAHLDTRSGVRPAWIYGGAGWLYSHLSPGKIDRYLWASSYTSEGYALSHIPGQFSWAPSLFVAQQFTDGQVGPSPHRIEGVGYSDLSYFRGDAKRLRAVAGVR